MVRVRVLGRLEVTGDDGRPLGAERLPRRARQVLEVLAARYDRVQSKDAIADAVWGDELPGDHAAALEHYVSMIRRRLQPGLPPAASFIVTRSGGYVLDTSRAQLDLAELRRLVREADGHPRGSPERVRLRERAVHLVDDLPFADDRYADWAQAPRDEVTAEVLAALIELSEHALAADPARALRLAREAIDLDSLVEEPYRTAMRAAAALGRTDEALRWAERCRGVLEEELGAAMSEETLALRASLLAGLRPAPAPAAPAVPPPAPREPGRLAFLGRRTELELLLGPEAAGTVHVTGPAGAGKSALLAECTRLAPGRAGIGQGPRSPGGPRLSWLRSPLAQLQASAAALAAVDDAMASHRPLSPRELEEIAGVLDRDEPVVLAVDDAATLDHDSVEALAWLRHRCPRLCVVVAYRYPSAIVGHPLAGLGADIVLRLGPLSPEELEPAGQPDLAAMSGGIPALVAAAQRPGPVATSVAMHVARLRTEWMAAPGWEILRLCATLGSLRVDQLTTLTGFPLGEVLDRVDQLVHAHLMVEGPGGHVRHRSTLVRSAVGEQVTTAHITHLRERLETSGGLTG
jgi:DNA-binding SARP family transcriptional activator